MTAEMFQTKDSRPLFHPVPLTRSNFLPFEHGTLLDTFLIFSMACADTPGS